MIDPLSAFPHDDHPIRLNGQFSGIPHLWREFSTPGMTLVFSSPQWASLLDFHVSSHAVGAQGYGAIFDDEEFMG